MNKYGMRLRGFSIGCQPMEGFDHAEEDPLCEYWNILFYNRKLTDKEMSDYSLDYIGEEKK
jgi:hypothetical protein